jgi:hypothetical protein
MVTSARRNRPFVNPRGSGAGAVDAASDGAGLIWLSIRFALCALSLKDAEVISLRLELAALKEREDRGAAEGEQRYAGTGPGGRVAPLPQRHLPAPSPTEPERP